MRGLRAWKTLVGWVLTGLLCVACVWPVVWFVGRSLPLTGPVEMARHHAHAAGWKVPDGEPLQSDYVSGPDLLGGSDVEVTFLISTDREPWQTFVVRLHRPSFVADWQIVKSGERDMPLVR